MTKLSLEVVEDEIYDTIQGASALTDAVSTRVYRQLAPPDAAYPHIVYSLVAGGNENLTPSESMNVVYLIKAVSDVSASEVSAIADNINDVFGNDPTMIALGTNVMIDQQAEDVVRFTEVDPASGKVYWHAGARVRFRFDED